MKANPVVVMAAVLSACGAAGVGVPSDVLALRLTCAPASPGLHCVLVALSSDVSRAPRDVTSAATWHLSGGAGATISSEGTVDSAGDGNVEIGAEFQGRAVRLWVKLAHHHPGLVLATMRGHVYTEQDGSLRPAARARVELVAGPGAGRSTTALEDGSYEFPALVPGAVAVRAEKTGCSAGQTSIELLPGENRLNLTVETLPRTTLFSAL
jgi:hypothetical protein